MSALRSPAALLALGAATGLRSMAAPSRLSQHVRRRRRATTPAGAWLGNPWLSRLLRAAAIGEMIADKLPTTPDRIRPGPLGGRALLGAASGAGLARFEGRSVAVGALLGGIGAVAGAFAGYHLRRALVHSAGLPDLPLALCEDAVAIEMARRGLR